MVRLSRNELLLLVSPLLIAPAISLMRGAKVEDKTPAVPAPTTAHLPELNLYSNAYSDYEVVFSSSDSNFIYTGTTFEKLKFSKWDARSGRLIRSFGAFRYANTESVLSPNGKMLAFGHGGWNGDRIVVFDANTGKERLQIKKPPSDTYGFDMSNKLVALPTNDEVRVYDAVTGKLSGKFTHRPRDFYPRMPRFSPGGKRLLWIGFSSYDYEPYADGKTTDEIVCFDLANGRKLQTYSVPRTQMMQVRFTGDGKAILAIGYRPLWQKKSGGKREIRMEQFLMGFDTASAKRTFTKSLHTMPNDFAVSPDGKWFSFRSEKATDPTLDQSVAICEVSSGAERFRSKGSSTNCGSWSADSKTLYFADRGIRRVKLREDGKWSLHKWKSKDDLARQQLGNQPLD